MAFIDRSPEDMTGNRGERGGVTRSKGPRPGVEPGSAAEPWQMGRALPTELNGASVSILFN